MLDAGDVELYSGDAERSVRDLQAAVHTVAATGAIPLVLGGDHTIAWPDAAGVAQHVGAGRVSMIHSTRTRTPATSSSARSSATASRCGA